MSNDPLFLIELAAQQKADIIELKQLLQASSIAGGQQKIEIAKLKTELALATAKAPPDSGDIFHVSIPHQTWADSDALYHKMKVVDTLLNVLRKKLYENYDNLVYKKTDDLLGTDTYSVGISVFNPKPKPKPVVNTVVDTWEKLYPWDITASTVKKGDDDVIAPNTIKVKYK